MVEGCISATTIEPMMTVKMRMTEIVMTVVMILIGGVVVVDFLW